MGPALSALAGIDGSGINYSAGKNGSQLKWLPVQKGRSEVVATQYTSPSSGPGAAQAEPLPALPPAESSGVAKPSAPTFLAPANPTPINGSESKQSPFTKELEREMSPNQPSLQEACPSAKDLKHIVRSAPASRFRKANCRTIAHWATKCFNRGASAKRLIVGPRRAFATNHCTSKTCNSSATGTWPVRGCSRWPRRPTSSPPSRSCRTRWGWNCPTSACIHWATIRPGSCACTLFDPLPLSLRGGLFEAGAGVGGVAIFP